MAQRLVLEFRQPEEGSFDMGYSAAYGHRTYEDDKGKFFQEYWQSGQHQFLTRYDGSPAFLDTDPFKHREEVTEESVKMELKEAKEDKRYKVHYNPFTTTHGNREKVQK